MRKIGLLVCLLLIAWVGTTAAQRRDTTKKPQRVRFLDLDGDGFNDLLPDLDRDGIPDDIDPDFAPNQRAWRWAWFRSIPDSARADTTRFRKWWENSHKDFMWQDAWARWREFLTARERGIDMRWMGMGGFSPRDMRFRTDAHHRKPRKGRGGMGGGQDPDEGGRHGGGHRGRGGGGG